MSDSANTVPAPDSAAADATPGRTDSEMPLGDDSTKNERLVSVPPPISVEVDAPLSDALEWGQSVTETWWPEFKLPIIEHLRRGDYSAAIAHAATLVEETVRGVADAPPDLGGVKLNAYAFAPKTGRLVSHLPGGEAEGLQKYFDGLSQAVRNKIHHNLGVALSPQEAVQTLSALNLGLTLAKRHAYDTYLRPFTSDGDFHYLLRVRHIAVPDSENPTRFVTYASGIEKRSGCALAAVETASGWRRVAGGVRIENAWLLGEISSAHCSDDDRAQVFAVFAPPGGQGIFAVVPLACTASELTLIAAPPEATWSWRRKHEFKDMLGRGRAQLVSYAAAPQPHQLWRRYFELRAGQFVFLYAELIDDPFVRQPGTA